MITALALGLVCWIATTIVVESELFRPLREWLARREDAALWGDYAALWGDYAPEERASSFVRGVEVPACHPVREVLWRKARYLLACHLCAGTWIALGLVALHPVAVFGPGFLGWALGGLLVKAIAHLALVAHKAGEAVAR